jgi:hypothetical protein
VVIAEAITGFFKDDGFRKRAKPHMRFEFVSPSSWASDPVKPTAIG